MVRISGICGRPEIKCCTREDVSGGSARMHGQSILYILSMLGGDVPRGSGLTPEEGT